MVATISSVNIGPSDPGDNPDVQQQDVPTATITTGEISFDDFDGQFSVTDDPFGIFIDYVINNKFQKDNRRYMMGVASPSGFQGSSVAFVQLASPTLLWVCDWTAMRLNSPPPIPDPESQDPDWVLLDDHYEPSILGLGPDGVTPQYRISGTYVYGHRSPDPVTISNIAFPRPPWMKDSFRRVLTNDDLLKDLTDT